MFCDVSGFTKLAEAMAKSGMGAEGLAKYLNQVRSFALVWCCVDLWIVTFRSIMTHVLPPSRVRARASWVPLPVLFPHVPRDPSAGRRHF